MNTANYNKAATTPQKANHITILLRIVRIMFGLLTGILIARFFLFNNLALPDVAAQKAKQEISRLKEENDIRRKENSDLKQEISDRY